MGGCLAREVECLCGGRFSANFIVGDGWCVVAGWVFDVSGATVLGVKSRGQKDGVGKVRVEWLVL